MTIPTPHQASDHPLPARTTITNEEIADTIGDIADLIDRVGLYQGTFWPGGSSDGNYQPGDPVCIVGGLAVTCNRTLFHLDSRPAPEDPHSLARWGAVHAALINHLPDGYSGIGLFNDDINGHRGMGVADDTAKQRVLDWLRTTEKDIRG